MRAVLSILIIFTLLTSCGDNTNKRSQVTDSETDQLLDLSAQDLAKHFRKINGVSEMKTIGFKYKFGKVDKEGILVAINNYDKKGNLTDSSTFYNDSVFNQITFEYDRNENLIESKSISPDGEIISKITQEFNDEGKITALFTFRKGEILHYGQRWSYDTLSNLVGFSTYDSTGNMDFKQISTYNEDNKIVRRRDVDARGNTIQEALFEYDKKGNNTSLKVFNANEELIQLNIFDEHGKDNVIKKGRKFDQDSNLIFSFNVEHDPNGNETLYENFNPEGKLILRYESQFDENSNKTNYKKSVDEGLIFEDKVTLDSLGRVLTFEKFILENNKLAVSQYEFDENGLLKSKTIFDRVDEPKGVLKFEYKFDHRQVK